MKDEKKVKATEEEAKKEVQTEENGVQLTDEELAQVVGGAVPDMGGVILTVTAPDAVMPQTREHILL